MKDSLPSWRHFLDCWLVDLGLWTFKLKAVEQGTAGADAVLRVVESEAWFHGRDSSYSAIFVMARMMPEGV